MTLKKAIRWIVLALWLTLVIFLSCQSGKASGEMSAWFTKSLFRTTPPIAVHTVLRLLAHFIIHLVLGVLLFQAARYDIPQPVSSTLICGIPVAICDELIQIFITGRVFEFSDIALNLAGIFAALIICTIAAPHQKTALN